MPNKKSQLLKHLAVAALLTSFFVAPTWAQDSKVSDLPNDSSLSGAELFLSAQGGVSSNISLSQIDGFVGAGGQSIVNDITEAPYNATCDGVADDSIAFEDAVDDGGHFFVPPGSRCTLKSTANHVWDTVTVFYGLEGAQRDTHIDIDGADNFLLQAGASVGLYNLTFKNGDTLIRIDSTLTGVVDYIECVNNIWDNVNTWCASWGQLDEDPGAKIDRILAHHNVVVASVGSRGFALLGGEIRDVNIHHNDVTGGERGIKIGFVGNSDARIETDQRERIVISNNNIKDIDGNGTVSNTHCINVHGRYAIITGNICKNMFDATSPTDTHCIYSKSQRTDISNNILINCGESEGGIIWKGTDTDPPTCTIGSCSRYNLIANNIIFNDRFDIGNDYNCIHAQGSEVSIIGNQLNGCTDKAIKVTTEGDNVLIANNSIMNFAGGTGPMISLRKEGDNMQIIGNMFYLYVDAEVTTTNLIQLQLEDTWTSNAWAIRDNQFFVPDITEGDDIIGIFIKGPATGSATLNDLDITNNFFHADMDHCIKITNNITVDRLSIHGNSMRCDDPYEEAGASTVTNCEVYGNRGWKINDGPCGAADGGDT